MGHQAQKNARCCEAPRIFLCLPADSRGSAACRQPFAVAPRSPRDDAAKPPRSRRNRLAIVARSRRRQSGAAIFPCKSHGAFVFAMIRLIYKGAWQPCLLYYSFSPCFHNGYLSAKQATASKGASSTFVIKKRHAAPVAAELLARHGAMG